MFGSKHLSDLENFAIELLKVFITLQLFFNKLLEKIFLNLGCACAIL